MVPVLRPTMGFRTVEGELGGRSATFLVCEKKHKRKTINDVLCWGRIRRTMAFQCFMLHGISPFHTSYNVVYHGALIQGSQLKSTILPVETCVDYTACTAFH